MIKEMPATKRPSDSSRSHAAHQHAFDSFVGRMSPGPRKECILAASELLQKSSSYKRTVDRLNLSYVSAAEVERRGDVAQFEPDDDGKLTKGPFSGRHTLAFGEPFGRERGNRFYRAGAFQTQTTAFPLSDWIILVFPEGDIDTPARRGKAIAQLVGSIAHETLHASHRVTAAPSLTRAQRADAFIEEEVATRKGEETILKEILSPKVGLETVEQKAKAEGVRKLIEGRVGTMVLSRPEVERDFLSGTQLTYLEAFVIEDLIGQSIRVEKLNSSTIQENMELVNNLDYNASAGEMLQSAHPELRTWDKETELLTTHLPTQFAELFLVRRLVMEHWQESGKGNRESVVQGHKKAFFPPDVAYTALP